MGFRSHVKLARDRRSQPSVEGQIKSETKADLYIMIVGSNNIYIITFYHYTGLSAKTCTTSFKYGSFEYCITGVDAS
jgi:hypothetical protein